MTDLAPDAAAFAWATEILETQWQPVRFRLELEEECWRTQPGAEREHYQARFRVWELAGLTRIDEGPEPSPTAFPADTEHLVDFAGRCTPECDSGLLEQALQRAVRSSPAGLSLQVRGVHAEPRAKGGTRRWFVIEKSSSDSQLVIDYDPHTDRRLGYLCGPFYRGSTRSAAIGRSTAIKRAQSVLGVPPGSRLSRAKVSKGSWGRVWRMRWEVDTAAAAGVITASLNARSGVVCVYFSTVASRPQLHAPDVASRDRAAIEIAAAAHKALGDGLVIGDTIPTAVGVASGRPQAAWLAVVRAPDRRIYRALHRDGRVELKLSA